MMLILIYFYNLIMNNKTKNKRKENNIQIILSLARSTAVIDQVLIDVLGIVQLNIDAIERRNYVRNCLINQTYLNFKSDLHDTLNFHLDQGPLKCSLSSDDLPKNIPIDNLTIPTIVKNIKNSNITKISRSRSIVLTPLEGLKTQQSTLSKSLSVRLPLQTIQQLKIVGEMRQRKMDDQLYLKNQFQKQQNQRLAILSKKLKYIDKLGFDYSGKILNLNTSQYGNMIQKILQQKLRKQKIAKKNQKTPQPSGIVGTKISKNLKNAPKSQIKSETMQFLDTQSLNDNISINKGIRYSHNSLVFEEKKKKLSIPELKGGLGKRKISKSQFLSIKESTTTNKQKYKTQKTVESRLTQQRSYSQANLQGSRFRRRDVINIINPELKESMLIKLEDYEPFLVIQKQFQEDQQTMTENRMERQKSIDDSISVSPSNHLTELLSIDQQGQQMASKFPSIKRKTTLKVIDSDNLIITKLQQQLQNKLRI